MSELSFKALRVDEFGDDDSLIVEPGLFTLAHQVAQVGRALAEFSRNCRQVNTRLSKGIPLDGLPCSNRIAF
jgi:hypothetical protein